MNLLPIRTIAELTGVPATTLRAWERRYGLLKPQRAPSGHRLYSQDDVARVRLARQLLSAGHSISGAAQLIRSGEASAADTPAQAHHWPELLDRLLNAVAAFDEQRLAAVYREALAGYPVDLVVHHLLLPALRQAGERWQRRECGIAEEHFLSQFLRLQISARLAHATPQHGGRRLLLACLPQEHHDLGLLLFALSLQQRGYRLLYLGANLPLDQIPPLWKRARLDGVILSGSDDSLPDCQSLELPALCRALPGPCFFGGGWSSRYRTQITEAGGICLADQHESALATLDQVLPAYGARME